MLQTAQKTAEAHQVQLIARVVDVPLPRFAGHKEEIEDYRKDQLSYTDAHIEAVQKSIPELDESATKVTEVRQEQHAEFMTDCQRC